MQDIISVPTTKQLYVFIYVIQTAERQSFSNIVTTTNSGIIVTPSATKSTVYKERVRQNTPVIPADGNDGALTVRSTPVGAVPVDSLVGSATSYSSENSNAMRASRQK